MGVTFNRGERQKPTIPEYLDNWDLIWGDKPKDKPETPKGKDDD